MILGSLVNAGGSLLLGPSYIFNAPDKLEYVCIGCGLIGIGCAMVFPNALPEICLQVNAVFKKNKDYNNNMAAGIFRLLQGIGQVSGPLLGTLMVDQLSPHGFKSYADITCLVWVIYAVLYFFIGGGIEALKNPNVPKKQQPEKELLSSMTNRQDLFEQFDKLKEEAPPTKDGTQHTNLVTISEYMKEVDPEGNKQEAH